MVGGRSVLTRLADAEELICVPGDDAAGQSAPAPFYDTAKSLCMLAHLAG